MRRLPLPKFYRYLIYWLYTKRIESKDDTLVTTVIVVMFVSHVFQLFFVCSLLSKLLPGMVVLFKQNKLVVGLSALFLMTVYEALIYNKQRWQEYIDEFKDEPIQQRLNRSWLVALFTIGSAVLFFILVPLLFA